MRNPTFDIMKGIGILAMIIGHCPIPLPIRELIFSWHMPLFFIISGFFYKKNEYHVLFKKNVRGLIKPYIFTVLCCVVLICTTNILNYCYFCSSLIKGQEKDYSVNSYGIAFSKICYKI